MDLGSADFHRQFGYIQLLDEINGFPVLVREFDGGLASSEVFLKSATRQSLSNELFSVPDGYKEVDPFAQMGGRR